MDSPDPDPDPDPDPQAADRLLPLVYQELRQLAAAKMYRERPGQTLQATALVHEAYLRMQHGNQRHFKDKTHFFRAAAEAMRRILIDRARKRQVRERAGYAQREEELSDSKIVLKAPSEELLAVHEALDDLAAEDEQAAELVKLRYFVGMTLPEASEAMGIGLRTAERIWTFARARLRQRIQQT